MNQHRRSSTRFTDLAAIGTLQRALRGSVPVFAAVGAAACLTGAGLVLFSSAGRDDAYITYWAAYTLSSHQGLTNYNGEPVEQGSSLAQVGLLAALASKTDFDLVTLGKASSVFFGFATVLWTFRLASRLHPDAGWRAAWIVATIHPLMYWSFGGLESTLTSFAALAVIIAMGKWHSALRRNGLIKVAATATLVLLARPEGPLILLGAQASALMFLFLRRNVARCEAARTVVPFVLATCLVLLIAGLRGWFFHQIFPQPVYAKTSGLSEVTLRAGVRYLWTQFTFNGAVGAVVWLALLAGVVAAAWRELRAPRSNAWRVYSLAFVLVSFTLVLLSGGDWMEGGRFLVPILPVTVALCASELVWRLSNRRRLNLAVALLVAFSFLGTWRFAATESTGLPIWQDLRIDNRYNPSGYSWFERRNRVNLRELPVITNLDELLGELTRRRRPVSILTGQMGMVAFHTNRKWAGAIEWIDKYGLTDRRLTGCTVGDSLPRSQLGLRVTYEWFFRNVATLEMVCRIPRPDIIFDIDFSGRIAREVEAAGYWIVFKQTGSVAHPGTLLPGAYVHAEEFIAVRPDLAATLPSAVPTVVNFSELIR